MKIRQILSEIVWEEQYAAMKAAKRFPNAWIHFTQIPKLGINPSKTHHDPPGIYFYPCRWLLSYAASTMQYAVSYPYYFICRIRPTANSVNLARMTTQRARAIAERNGWLQDFDRVIQTGVLRSRDNPMDPKLLRRPGGLFYAALDYLVNVEKRGSWLQLLRGVDALFDNGAGIIAGGETHQVCVIDRRVLTVLDQGQNKDEWDQIHAKMMQDLATEFGGNFYYKHKIPTIDVQIDGKPIRMEFDAGNWRMFLEYYRNGQWIRTQERYENPSHGDYANILQSLRYQLTRAADNATPGGVSTYWTSERILGLFDLMFNDARQLFRTSQHDNEITYSVSWDSGIIRAAIFARIIEQDALDLTAYLAFQHDTVAEAHDVLLPGTNIQEVAASFLNHILEQAKANRPELHWDDPKLHSIIRFKLPFG